MPTMSDKRRAVRYTGTNPIALFGGIYAETYQPVEGAVFEVDAAYGEGLIARPEGDFEAATDEELEAYRADPGRPAPSDAPGVPSPLDLKGDALAAAVDSWNTQHAGTDRVIDKSATADEKRAALAAYLGHDTEGETR